MAHRARSGLTVAQANTALDSVAFTPTDKTGGSGNFSTDISVEVDDGDSGFVSALGPTTVTITRINDDPTLDNAILDQGATEDILFNFTFAANTFGDVDVGDTLTYTAQLSGGGSLPGWLGFTGATRTFTGTPLNGDVGTISIDLIADDGNGGTPAVDTFNITVDNSNVDTPLAQGERGRQAGRACADHKNWKIERHKVLMIYVYDLFLCNIARKLHQQAQIS